MGFFFMLLVIGFLILILYMFWEAHANRTISHQLSFPDFPYNKWTIFFISDIHRRKVSEKIIAYAEGKADLVIIGGDLAEKGVKLEQVKVNLLRLKKIAPIYFVWGNNDYELDEESLKNVLSETEVKVLDNCACTFVTPDGEELALIGIDDLSIEKADLNQALANVKDTSFKILVSHEPSIIREITPEQNIRAVLSGHTHGGQIRIFGFSPYEKGGIKERGNMILFVSNGYGTTAFPFRLGAKAETHLITFTRS